ncbi:prophage protein [Lactobacillus phage phiAQ113]|uniref:prophage protein n=1 Tax=Lactobacillus phage phiAQ113 TaxID=1206110 RepID=UPI00029F9B63|nr:prophage protein [Lactobacillus phage phiAQ113]CCI88360.1 prophage protein [Lactobacillus phage phiAQ113]
MIEFDDKDLRDLQEVDGIVLQDVHGKRVAIGKGFDYGNVFQFMTDYFDEYGAEDFAKQVGYEDVVEMFKEWFSGILFNESDLMDWVCESFAGIDADSLQDQYDYENEDYLEAEDHKLDQERGK